MHFSSTKHYVYEWYKFDLEHFDQMKVFLILCDVARTVFSQYFGTIHIMNN
jgi:hypothetical protein